MSWLTDFVKGFMENYNNQIDGSNVKTGEVEKIENTEASNKPGSDYVVVTVGENVSDKYKARVNTEKAKEKAKEKAAAKAKGRTTQQNVRGEA